MGNEATLVSDQRQASAAEVALVYANDGEPGIRRRRAGKGFRYLWPDGERVRDPAVLDRIRGLVVPPAWADVWIAPSADCHLQVDRQGRARPQAVPLPRAVDRLPRRGEVRQPDRVRPRPAAPAPDDRRRPRPARPRTGQGARDRDAPSRHHDDPGRQCGLCPRQRQLRDHDVPRPARQHRRLDPAVPLQGQVGQGMATQGDGPPRRPDRQGDAGPARPAALPVYRRRRREAPRRLERRERLHSRGRRRTVHLEALPHLGRHGSGAAAVLRPRAARFPAGLALATNEVIDAVARRLGNTRAVCRKCYIHPRVLAHWEAGRLAEEIAALRRRYRKAPTGLDRSEQLALRWLETAEAGERPARAG